MPAAESNRRASRESPLTAKMRKRGYLMCTEAAERIGVHKTTIYRWIHDGRIEATDFSGAYYVKWDSVIKMMGDMAEILGLTPDTGNGA